MAIRPTNHRTDVNRSAILAHLGAHGPASRADLARALDVSPALMTQLTKDLLADGLLVELEQAPSQGGRPARMLGLVASAGRAIGVKVVADHVAFVEVGHRRHRAALGERAVRRARRDAPRRPRRAAPALHRRRQRAPAARHRRRRARHRRPPGQRHRRLARSSAGTRSRSARRCAASSACRCSSRTTSTRSPWPSDCTASGAGTRASSSSRSVPASAPASWSTGSYFAGSPEARARSGTSPSLDDGPLCGCGNHGCLEAHHRRSGPGRARPQERGVIGAHGGRRRPCAPPPTRATRAPRRSSARPATCSVARSPASCTPSTRSSSSCSARARRPGPHWAYGFEPAFRSALMPSRRGIRVAVETWQDESWAQGAAALVLATPFDSDGVAGEQGRLVRERLVEQAGRVMSALSVSTLLATVLDRPARRGRGIPRRRRPSAGRRTELRYALTVLAFLLPSAMPLALFVLGPMVAAAWVSLHEWNLLSPAEVGRPRQLRGPADRPADRARSSCTRCTTSRLPAARLRRRARARARAQHAR